MQIHLTSRVLKHLDNSKTINIGKTKHDTAIDMFPHCSFECKVLDCAPKHNITVSSGMSDQNWVQCSIDIGYPCN